MIVIYEVAFGSGKFEVSAILTKNGIFSSSVRGKARVIVSEGGGFVFFGEKAFANGVKYVN